jgi:hypothetical protein
MLVRNTSIRFTVPHFTATASASPGTEILLKVDSGTVDEPTASGLKGQLIVFYNSDDPRQYVIKAIQKIFEPLSVKSGVGEQLYCMKISTHFFGF